MLLVSPIDTYREDINDEIDQLSTHKLARIRATCGSEPGNLFIVVTRIARIIKLEPQHYTWWQQLHSTTLHSTPLHSRRVLSGLVAFCRSFRAAYRVPTSGVYPALATQIHVASSALVATL